MVQIAPSEEETKKLKGYLEQPGKTLADLSTPEQFMHVIGQVSFPAASHLTAVTVCGKQHMQVCGTTSSTQQYSIGQ